MKKLVSMMCLMLLAAMPAIAEQKAKTLLSEADTVTTFSDDVEKQSDIVIGEIAPAELSDGNSTAEIEFGIGGDIIIKSRAATYAITPNPANGDIAGADNPPHYTQNITIARKVNDTLCKNYPYNNRDVLTDDLDEGVLFYTSGLYGYAQKKFYPAWDHSKYQFVPVSRVGNVQISPTPMADPSEFEIINETVKVIKFHSHKPAGFTTIKMYTNRKDNPYSIFDATNAGDAQFLGCYEVVNDQGQQARSQQRYYWLSIFFTTNSIKDFMLTTGTVYYAKKIVDWTYPQKHELRKEVHYNYVHKIRRPYVNEAWQSITQNPLYSAPTYNVEFNWTGNFDDYNWTIN